MNINEAAQVAKVYGYGVSQGNEGSVFIMRKISPMAQDSVALVMDDREGTIIPYTDDYNAQDHMVATAISACRSGRN